jgi:hypothetical protein
MKKWIASLGLAVVAATGTFAVDWVPGQVLDIVTGEPLGILELKKAYTLDGQVRKFQKLHTVQKFVPMAPGDEVSASNEIGNITIYRDGSDVSQIRGVHKGAQFDSVGASQIPFNGRNFGNQGGNNFIQFFSDKATVIVANNYPSAGLDAATLAMLERTSPGCVTNGVVLTAVVLAKPSGLEATACFNQVVELK